MLSNYDFEEFLRLVDLPEYITNSVDIFPDKLGVMFAAKDKIGVLSLIPFTPAIDRAMQELEIRVSRINIEQYTYSTISRDENIISDRYSINLYEVMAMSPTPVNVTELNFDLTGLYNSSNPVYIVALNTEKVLFANPAALSAQQHTADEFIGSNFAALTYPEELEKRIALIRQDNELTNYEYKAMNWYKDGEMWRRKEMQLVSNFTKIDWSGTEARICIELKSEETRRFVD